MCSGELHHIRYFLCERITIGFLKMQLCLNLNCNIVLFATNLISKN